MDDTISRQVAIENSFEVYTKEYGWCEVVGVDALLELPSAQPEQQWIPVSERLPEEEINPNTQDYEWVLCSTTFGDVRAYHYGRGRFLHGCGDVTQYVTAWMPLPEPYREEGNDEQT